MRNLAKSFENGLRKFSDKLAQNKFMNVIGSAFAMVMPMTIIGSLASLFKGVNVGGYQAWLQSTPLYDLLGNVYLFTTGMLALYLVFCSGYQYAQKSGQKKQALAIGLTSLLAFFIVTPYTQAGEASPVAQIPVQWLGAPGLFMALVVGMLTGFIFKFCLEHHVEIKLPEQVPPTIARQFSALLPILFVCIFFSLINWIFSLTPYGDVQNAFYTLLSIPLKAIRASVFGLFFLWAFMFLLWFFGIHGGMIVGPMFSLVFMELGMANLEAYQAGLPLPHMFIGTCISVGSGSLPLLLAVLLTSKSKASRSVAKLAIIPSFFGVDEPAYFGIPMIMNPLFFIPWVIVCPAISVFGTYLFQLIGLLGYPTGARAGNFVPFLLSNMVGFGVRGLICGFLFVALCTLAYIPFVRIYDHQCLEKEQNAAHAEE